MKYPNFVELIQEASDKLLYEIPRTEYGLEVLGRALDAFGNIELVKKEDEEGE